MQLPISEWYAFDGNLSEVLLEQNKENHWYRIEKKAYACTKSLFSSDVKIHYEYKPSQQKGRNLLARKGWCFIKAIETHNWYSYLQFCIRDPKKEIRWLSFKEIASWSSFSGETNSQPVYFIAAFADFLRIISQLDDWQHYDKIIDVEDQKELLKNSAESLASILIANKHSYAYQDPPSESQEASLAKLVYAKLVELQSVLKREVNNEALLIETEERLIQLENLLKMMGLKP